MVTTPWGETAQHPTNCLNPLVNIPKGQDRSNPLQRPKLQGVVFNFQRTAMPVTNPVACVRFTCDMCREVKPQHAFSAAGGLCLACFDAHFHFCDGCGTLMQTSGYDNRYIGLYAPGAAGELCGDCGESVDGWLPTPLDVSFATYNRLKSTRKYGVEIETSFCPGWASLRGTTPFGCKEDCSISGMEFDSPILYGDEGLASITSFLTWAKEGCWRVNRDCGCHIHLDVRGETRRRLLSIAGAYRRTTTFWRKLVPAYRRRSSYCCPPSWTWADLQAAARMESFASSLTHLGCHRGEGINLTAYRRHQTIEVRLLEGTLDAETIGNWICCHTRFIDAVKEVPFDDIPRLFPDASDEQLPVICRMLPDLASWLKARYGN